MIDTLKLRHVVPIIHEPNKLYDLGFVPVGRSRWARNVRNTHEPRLTWEHNERDGKFLLKSEFSLPKFLFGSNLIEATPEQIDAGLHDITNYVQNHSNIEFDAHTAVVTRIDYPNNFHLDNDENKVLAYIRAFERVSLSHCNRAVTNGETVTWYSRGKRRLREIQLYSKFPESVSHGEPLEVQEAARGVLRLETRFYNEAVTRLAKKLNVERTAAALTQPDVWQTVLSGEMSRIGLNRPIRRTLQMIEDLQAAFGSNIAPYLGFLQLREIIGTDFYKRGYMSRESYYRLRKNLINNNLLDNPTSRRKLPALKLSVRTPE